LPDTEGSTAEHVVPVGADRGSRATILKTAAVAGAALTTGGLLTLQPKIAFSAPSSSGDERILNFVLLLEHVQAAFYAEARRQTALGSDIVEFAKVVGGHEADHVAALEHALGPKARKRPTLHFGAATRNRQKFLAAAIELEDLGVAAYNGQAANLTPGTLVTAAEIVSVEARHAGWIRALAGKLPAVGPTDQPLTSGQTMAALAKTGFVAGLHP
jgi:Ferritin-like domain